MITLPFVKAQDLRYGNPHQKASFTGAAAGKSQWLRQNNSRVKNSLNNINDLNAAWELVKEFDEPTVVALKHANPAV